MTSWKSFAPKALLAAAAVSFSMSIPTPTIAQDSLIFSIYIPPRSGLRSRVLQVWADQVNEAAGGALTVEVPTQSVGALPAQFTNLADGVIDVALIPASFLPPPMRSPNIVDLPFTAESSEAASIAGWRTWEAFLSASPAWADFRLLGLIALSDTTFQCVCDQPLDSLAALQGLKLNSTPGPQSAMLERFGAIPVPAPGPARVEQLSGGVVDGNVMSPNATMILGLNRFIRNAVTVRGLTKNAFLVMMRQDRFDELSPESQAAIESVSGEALSQAGGRNSDADWERGLAGLREDPNVAVSDAPAEMIAELRSATEFITQGWIERTNAMGLDGQAALDFYIRTAAEIQSGM